MSSTRVIVTCPKGHKLLEQPVGLDKNGKAIGTGFSGSKICRECRRNVRWTIRGLSYQSEYR